MWRDVGCRFVARRPGTAHYTTRRCSIESLTVEKRFISPSRRTSTYVTSVCPSVCLSASISLTHTYYYYYYCCCVVRSSLQSYSNDRTDISTTYRLQWLYAEVMWRGGVVVRASDLQPRRGRFESRPLRSTCNPGQVVYTHVPLFTKQYKLVPGTPRDTLAPCLRTCSFGWCLAEGY